MIAVLTLDEIDKIEINLSPIFGELKINKKAAVHRFCFAWLLFIFLSFSL